MERISFENGGNEDRRVNRDYEVIVTDSEKLREAAR